MKILIVGIVASGKTTLAKKLSSQNNIKYFEIDSIVHDDKNNITTKKLMENATLKNRKKEIVITTKKEDKPKHLKMRHNLFF